MEQACDFLWKLYTRLPQCQRWIAQNPQKWEELYLWLDKNRQPPYYANHMPQYAQKGSVRMWKSRHPVINKEADRRYDHIQNNALYLYRAQCFLKMKKGEVLNLTAEIDLDSSDC